MVAVTRVGTTRALPPGAGHRTYGPDEDGFTLAVEALEALSLGGGPPPDRASMLLVGTIPPVGEWGLPAALGLPGLAVRAPSTGDALARGMSLAKAGGVVVVEVGESPGGRPDRPQPFAVALLLEDQNGWELVEADQPASGEHASSLRALDSLRGSAAGKGVSFGVGQGRSIVIQSGRPIPWTASGSARESTSPTDGGSPGGSELGAASLARVSEGAYIPHARYRESIPSRWRFVAEACPACGHLNFPSRGACSQCHNGRGLLPRTLPLDGGTVISLTTIGKGGQPTEFDPLVEASGSYQVAIVELVPGCRATLQVSDAPAGAMAIGSRVSTRLRRLYPMEGEWRYGRKAVPWAGEPVAGST